MMNIPVNSHAASIVAIREDTDEPQMLMVKRTGKILKDQWLHIAGGIEENERPWQTVVRELKEETGLLLDRLYSANICEQFYCHVNHEVSIVPVFVGYVKTPPEVVLNHEHSDYRWVTFEEAIKLGPFPNHGKLYREIRDYFVLGEPNPLMEIKIPL